MYLISKIFTWLFLSPMILIMTLGLSLYFLHCKEYLRARLTVIVVLVLFVFLSTRVGRDVLCAPLEFRYQQPMKIYNGVIIVLGGGVTESAPDYAGGPALSDSSLKRVMQGYRLYRKHYLPLIVCGGTPMKNGTAEGKVMGSFLVELGVPRAMIYVEKNSRNTYENGLYIYEYLKEFPGRKYMVTSALHTPRSVKVFKKLKVEVIPTPCDYRAERVSYHWYDIFPQWRYLNDSFAALKEYVGVVYYKIYYRV
jgi:uncharacterized SAM-binding protein YcdF (DUF218 family)